MKPKNLVVFWHRYLPFHSRRGRHALCREGVGWENVVIWKNDIVDTFNQFIFSAESTKLLALRISTLIMFTGVFGWLGSPAV